ncbi:DnaD domain-containing protein [Bacillus sp. Hm123]|uniref:DnaD domain-containing protein n=1 Tax=Bacillus sp. Hm123 TaxID=3450745 RepID=UPI003F420721
MSKLLLDERPLVIIPSLATKVGLNESIILQQIHYWLQSSEHKHDDRKWVYNTYEQWQEHFPFWSISTIRRSIKSLEDAGLLIAGNFNKRKSDKTKWYSIDFEKVEGLNSSSVQNEQSTCSKRTVRVFKLNRTLPKSTSKSTSDIKKEVEEDAAVHDPVNNPFDFWENNGFGTPGSLITQKIISWCEDLSDEMVIYAMQLAVENGKTNWTYVETILRSWAQKKLTTVAQVKADQLAFKQQRSQSKQSRGYNRRSPIREEKVPDWLNKQNDQQQKAEYAEFKEEQVEAQLKNEAEIEKKRAELEARIKGSREGLKRE